MGIKVRVQNGIGDSREMCVDRNNSAQVTLSGMPPENTRFVLKPYTALLKNSAGSSDMLVTGTIADPKDFFVQAGTQGDRYIHTVAFTISDAGASLKQFGSIAALTNGCEFFYEDSQVGLSEIGDTLHTNFDFIQLCNFEPFFGSGDDAFRARNVSGNSEAYIPILDIEDVFGLPHGVKLGKGKDNKLVFRINDDVTAIDRFDIRVFGFDRIFIDN